jgi:hypothetical protein
MPKKKLIPESVKCVEFTIGGFFSGHDKYAIGDHGDQNEDDFFRLIKPLPGKEDQVLEFARELLLEIKVQEWDNYFSSNILDGTQWELVLVMKDGRRVERSGSNAYPSDWKKFLKLINKYFKN